MIRFFLLISIILHLYGCAAPSRAGATPAPMNSGDGLSPGAAALRSRLTNTDNGLEVRRWVIADQSDHLRQAIAKYADGLADDHITLENLKRNGIRFVRVPADSVESLLADLGGASYDATEWHGQVVEWRSIVDRPVQPEGQAVAIDGVVSRFETGEFRLMIRSWTVQMEHGPYLYLEMAPRRRLSQGNNLRRLLGDGRDVEQSFASVALDAQLEAGYAYLIASESPHIEWSGLDGDAGQTPSTAPAAAAASSRRVIDFGPETVAPPTIGELLLSPATAARSRGVLVLVPKIAPELFLPEQLAARSQPGTNGNRKGAGGS